jgi:hypothetical protein
MSQVWKLSKAKASALLLELAIADYAHDDGSGAYPSIETLAKKIRMSGRQVQRLVQTLQDMGELSLSEPNSHRTPEYTVTPGGDKMSPPVGQDVTRGVTQLCRPRGDMAMSPDPSLNHHLTNGAPKPPRPRDPLFDAITTTCRVDPATAGSGIAKAKQRLTKAAPPYTAEDVAAFGRWWVKQYGADRPPTVWQLAERIGVIRTAAAKPSLGMYFEED